MLLVAVVRDVDEVIVGGFPVVGDRYGLPPELTCVCVLVCVCVFVQLLSYRSLLVTETHTIIILLTHLVYTKKHFTFQLIIFLIFMPHV